MRVLVAGATGVLGRQLVPLLQSEGHEVVGLSRTAADGVVAVDALDPAALGKAVHEAAPEAVVNLLTAIPHEIRPRRFAEDMALTNRLRSQATRTLLDEGAAAGATRFVSESLAFAYDPAPGPADEDAPLWVDPPAPFRSVLRAVRDREELTRAAGGAVLRFGHLVGPGTAYGVDGSFVRQVRGGKVPLVGEGASTFSFVHVADAAAAVAAALSQDVAGTLNVVDDHPAPAAEWLPGLAEVLGARRPRSVPVPVARLVAGPWGVAFMTRLRGASNARARQLLDWSPRYPSWRESFADLAVSPRRG